MRPSCDGRLRPPVAELSVAIIRVKSLAFIILRLALDERGLVTKVNEDVLIPLELLVIVVKSTKVGVRRSLAVPNSRFSILSNSLSDS